MFSSFIESVTTNYANFDGLATRKDAWAMWIFPFLIAMVVGIFGGATSPDVASTIVTIFQLAIFIPGIAVIVRRFHDINKSGWNYLWILTIIGIIPVLYWIYIKPSVLENNKYRI